MGKRHLFFLILVIAGAFADEVAPPEGEEVEVPGDPEDPVPAAAPTPPEAEPADDSSGVILTSEEGEAASEGWNDTVLAAPQAGPTLNFIREHIKYTWTIINYSHNHKQFQEALFSPQFWGPQSKEYKWQLQLYPKGNNRDAPNGVGVYLALSGKIGVKPRVKVAIIPTAGRPIEGTFDSAEYKEETGHGWKSFTTQANLEAYKNVYLPNDRLTIEVQIIFSPRHESETEDCETVDKVCKKIPFKNNFHNDIHIYTEDTGIKAHAAAIAAESSWLKDQIETNRPYRVEIPPHMKITYDDLKDVVRFIYTGQIDPSEAKRLSEVADMLGMPRLKANAQEVLCLAGET